MESQLHEKEQQLHAAQGAVDGLREAVGRMEVELLALQRENAELLKSKQGRRIERTEIILYDVEISLTRFSSDREIQSRGCPEAGRISTCQTCGTGPIMYIVVINS